MQGCRVDWLHGHTQPLAVAPAPPPPTTTTPTWIMYEPVDQKGLVTSRCCTRLGSPDASAAAYVAQSTIIVRVQKTHPGRMLPSMLKGMVVSQDVTCTQG